MFNLHYTLPQQGKSKINTVFQNISYISNKSYHYLNTISRTITYIKYTSKEPLNIGKIYGCLILKIIYIL